MIPSLPYSLTLSLHFLSLPVSATISHTSCLPLCLFSFACFSRCNSPSLSLSLCRCLSGLRMSLCLPACVPATCLSHCVPHCPSPSRISPHTLPASLTVCLLLSQPVPVTACLLHCLCYCISSHCLSPSLPVSLTACLPHCLRSFWRSVLRRVVEHSRGGANCSKAAWHLGTTRLPASRGSLPASSCLDQRLEVELPWWLCCVRAAQLMSCPSFNTFRVTSGIIKFALLCF